MAAPQPLHLTKKTLMNLRFVHGSVERVGAMGSIVLGACLKNMMMYNATVRGGALDELWQHRQPYQKTDFKPRPWRTVTLTDLLGLIMNEIYIFYKRL